MPFLKYPKWLRLAGEMSIRAKAGVWPGLSAGNFLVGPAGAPKPLCLPYLIGRLDHLQFFVEESTFKGPNIAVVGA